MPLPLSITALNVPRVLATATVSPPVVRLLPLASFNCTVIVEVLAPLAVIEVGEAAMLEVRAEATAPVMLKALLFTLKPPRLVVAVSL